MNEDAQAPHRRTSPPRREEDYITLNAKIDTQFDILKGELQGFIAKALVAFAIIGIICTISLVGFGVVLSREGRNSDEIQAQRKASIFNTCMEQNGRHDETYARLIALAGPGKTVEERRRLEATLGLIDALAPKQNCQQLVAKSVKDG